MKKKQKKPNPIFINLENLTIKKVKLDPLDDAQVKSYDPFMTNRYVSMMQSCTLLVNEINRYDVPKLAHYEYYYSVLPKRKLYYPYIKKAKENEQEIINRLCLYYEIGKREAKDYMQILTDEQIDNIFQKYETR